MAQLVQIQQGRIINTDHISEIFLQKVEEKDVVSIIMDNGRQFELEISLALLLKQINNVEPIIVRSTAETTP